MQMTTSVVTDWTGHNAILRENDAESS
jgi:hypothetical protein